MTEQLLKLPEKPGTVIAIGTWWLVRLRPYGDAPSAWELLPMPDDETSEHAKRQGVRTQCVYGDEWVLAEVEQEGGYVVISDPRGVPSGVQYFTPGETRRRKLAPEQAEKVAPGFDVDASREGDAVTFHLTQREPEDPLVGARVWLEANSSREGKVTRVDAETGLVSVRWDVDGSETAVRRSALVRNMTRQRPWKRGDRVTLQPTSENRIWRGKVVRQISEDEVLVIWNHDKSSLDHCYPPALEREQ